MGKKIRVRCKAKVFYPDHLRSQDAIIEYDMDDSDDGTLPDWAERVDIDEELSEAGTVIEPPKEVALSEIANATKTRLSRPSRAKAKKSKKGK